jgi:RNA polymerase sigma-70 factor (ECF subfamily)
MVHNRSLNRLRDAQTRRRHAENSVALGKDTAPPAEVSEVQAGLQKALDQLPTECRRIFELSRFEELKYREIADQLNISIKTVETQMGKALRLMRIHLAEFLSLVFYLFWFNKLP